MKNSIKVTLENSCVKGVNDRFVIKANILIFDDIKNVLEHLNFLDDYDGISKITIEPNL